MEGGFRQAATTEEKERAIADRNAVQARDPERTRQALLRLRETALQRGNLFESLMEACKVSTLGQISGALYDVGGQYRRNM